MIKEFNNETQAKAIAESLGLFITKYKGVYIVSNSKEEILDRYNLEYYSREGIFYDREIFKVRGTDVLVIKDKNIVDASTVEIPYNLRSCSCMFSNCPSLEIPPIIPACVKDCSGMFSCCASLKIPPIIPACVKDCSCMFLGCTSLETPPIIPEGALNCSHMFEGCVSLMMRPKIPEKCNTEDMFRGCTTLEGVTEDSERYFRYTNMFRDCAFFTELPREL